MNYLKITFLLLVTTTVFGQSKNFIDAPYIETSAKVDTLVSPDKIYLNILISEKDTRGKVSVEDLERKMTDKLKSLQIDLAKQLTLIDLSSNFKKYFFKQQDIQKSKLYSLLVYDAKTAGQVIVALENESISNIILEKTEYSKIESLKLLLKSRAIIKAKQTANAMITPLNQKVGTPLFISDTNSNITNFLQGSANGISIRGVRSMMPEYNSNTEEIEFKKIKIEIEVYAKFKID
ncbi:SIMPL domain-containing protein [Flavobacterium sp. '19STA2R22 D10 B1']|uniref:SIMPL domain-containing protein n=1 Tax=Flavobacterium aerium TaxID=3037261 RepID=UPI00278C8419|nr:SIMPL domain-containing protein [Flavobacterium sp. '19STA2R22 D10 B1']